jgi:nucleotide-binding universal stress UspA family protein
MKVIQKILIPTDCSEASLAGVEYATSMAESYGAQIVLLYVSDHPKEKAARELQQLAAKRLPRETLQVVRRGDPSKEIVRFATSEGIDIIIMATHGRTGISHVLMGSVAEKVVRYSPVPVLTVKHPGMRTALLEAGDVAEQLHMRTGR